MKKFLLICSVLVLVASCQEKDKSIANKRMANADSTFTVKVQVIDDADSLKSVLSDNNMAEHLLKFKVVEVTNGMCDKNEIRVLWRPRKGMALENGKVYTLSLKPAYILNSDLKEERTGYYEQLDGGC